MRTLAAALTFFTRLPLWRLVSIPDGCYRRIVGCWAPTGWLTAGVSAAVLYGAALVLPQTVAVLLAVAARLLLTGGLHEDGLADFLDGFGGGTTRERTLSIMKDSHIGTYGTIGLIVYFLLLAAVLGSMPVPLACAALLAGDPFSKFTASLVVNTLPYARTAEQAKSGVVNERLGAGMLLTASLSGLLPGALLLPSAYWLCGAGPLLCFWALTRLMKRRIGGYTGDCCGALFLIGELSFYLLILVIYGIYGTGIGATYVG